MRFRDHDTAELTGASVVRTTDSSAISDWRDDGRVDHVDDAVLQISGAGHWFLEGWIGDHSVEFLMDSGSSVTAMSDSLYQTLIYVGALVGALGCTLRTVPMGPVSGYLDVLTVWYRSWDC